MEDLSGTNPELIKEISSLQQKIKELEQSESERKRAPEELRENDEYFKAIIQNSSDIILVVDKLGIVTYASPSVEHILGYGPDELVGKRSLDLIAPDDKQRAIADFARALLVKEVLIPNIFRMKHKNGTERIFEGVGNNLFDNPSVAGFVMNIRDITDRKRMEEKLQKSEERYRALVENASDIIFRLDAAGRITFANPSGVRVTGYEEVEIIGKNYLAFIRPDMRDEAIKFFGRQFVKRINNTYSEYPILTKEGHEVWLGQNTQLIVEDGNVIGFQSMSRDITDRKRMEKELEESEQKYRELSIIDDLTQLYNSRHFYAQLQIETKRTNRYGQPLTLLLLDLDNFKAFNDAYGHIEGDHVLVRLGQVIKRSLRQTDSAYRYGGEEFTIILPMTTNREGAVTAERIRTEFVKETFSPAPGQNIHLTVSIGLSQYKTQEDMHAFVHRVDQFMYQGKKNGKDRVCCEP